MAGLPGAHQYPGTRMQSLTQDTGRPSSRQPLVQLLEYRWRSRYQVQYPFILTRLPLFCRVYIVSHRRTAGAGLGADRDQFVVMADPPFHFLLVRHAPTVHQSISAGGLAEMPAAYSLADGIDEALPVPRPGPLASAAVMVATSPPNRSRRGGSCLLHPLPRSIDRVCFQSGLDYRKEPP